MNTSCLSNGLGCLNPGSRTLYSASIAIGNSRDFHKTIFEPYRTCPHLMDIVSWTLSHALRQKCWTPPDLHTTFTNNAMASYENRDVYSLILPINWSWSPHLRTTPTNINSLSLSLFLSLFLSPYVI